MSIDRHVRALERQARATEDVAKAIQTLNNNVNKLTMLLVSLTARLDDMEKGGKHVDAGVEDQG